MSCKTYNDMAAVVMMLTRAPRTIPELLTLLGLNTGNGSHTRVTKIVWALIDEGLVVECGKRETVSKLGHRGRDARLYAWVNHAE